MSVSDSDIMDVAEDLFVEKGYTAVSTREIAQKAGITEMTLFRKFHTKRELFVRILKEQMSGDSGLTIMGALMCLNSKDELRAFLKQYFASYHSQRKIARMITISPEIMDKELFDFVHNRLIQAHSDVKQFLIQLFEEGPLSEEVKKKLSCKSESDFDVMALHILAQTMGFFFLGEVFKIASPEIWEKMENDFTEKLVELFF
jgi:AcrR family transcriptional regulator